MRRVVKILAPTFQSCRRQGFRTSAFTAAKITELVPALGESITEGTISAWAKNVGEAVAVDDVIVIVETDKVTVDIKSPHAGVLTAQLVTDEVEVGKPLYEIDTEGEAFAAPSAAPPTAAAPVEADVPASAPANSSSGGTGGHRVPLIKFIGKRSLVSAGASMPYPSAGPLMAPPLVQGNGADFRDMPNGAMFGRPQLSDYEAELIASGGASGW
jgi:hypothetical protein